MASDRPVERPKWMPVAMVRLSDGVRAGALAGGDSFCCGSGWGDLGDSQERDRRTGVLRGRSRDATGSADCTTQGECGRAGDSSASLGTVDTVGVFLLYLGAGCLDRELTSLTSGELGSGRWSSSLRPLTTGCSDERRSGCSCSFRRVLNGCDSAGDCC